MIAYTSSAAEVLRVVFEVKIGVDVVGCVAADDEAAIFGR